MRTYPLLTNAATVGLVLLGLAACQTQVKDNTVLRGGYEALDQKQYDQAIEAADRFLADNPTGDGAAEASYLRGRALEQRVKRNDGEAVANLNEARTMYNQALALRPARQLEGYIQTSLGNVSYWLDDYSTAEVQWQAALERLDREDLKSWVLYRIGLCQQRLGQWANADATFESVIRQYPGTEAAARSLGREGAREFYIQVAAFQNLASADRMIATLKGQGFPAVRFDQAAEGPAHRHGGPAGRLPARHRDARAPRDGRV